MQFKGPDALSRREPTVEEIKAAQENDDWLDEMGLCVVPGRLSGIDKAFHSPMSAPAFLMDHPADQVLCDIKKFLETMELPHFESVQARK
jgi:hypothetical protein